MSVHAIVVSVSTISILNSLCISTLIPHLFLRLLPLSILSLSIPLLFISTLPFPSFSLPFCFPPLNPPIHSTTFPSHLPHYPPGSYRS